MSDTSDRNTGVIEQFRANGGKVGGPLEGAPLLLLTTTGARTGERHTSPLMYLAYGDRMVVFASHGGTPNNPAWYHNIVAHPMATVEVGTKRFEATATIQTGEERDRLFNLMVEQYPDLGEHQKKTTRTIPVVALRMAGQRPR